MKPEDYTDGLGETVRAHRMYMGISKDEMARQLGMNVRSYERIETNQRACPPGLVDTIEAVVDRFEQAVESASKNVRDLEIRANTSEWTRAVYGRSAVESGRSLHSEP